MNQGPQPMKKLKSLVRALVERAGYHVVAKSFFGHDPFADFKTIFTGRPAPLVVDVGGFIGEFCVALKAVAPAARIHSFEPEPETYRRLLAGTRHLSDINAVNLALGSTSGQIEFHSNAGPATSSVLSVAPGEQRFMPNADLVCRTHRLVPVTRLDDYARENNLGEIDLLKTDTQGFELEVLRGAEGLFAGGAVRAVYCEVMFREFYSGQSYFHDIHAFLLRYRLRLAGLYAIGRGPTGEMLWADALYLRSAPP